MDWIIENKEWIFSGIGVFVFGIIGTFIFRRMKASKITQTQSSGTNSNNYQSAGDINVNIGDDNSVFDKDQKQNQSAGDDSTNMQAASIVINQGAVSYTHLTLPTIYSV